MSIRKWALALSMTVFGFGFVNQADAGFTGDTVSVSLTAHTTGAIDQVVFSGDTVTEPGAIVGDSQPNGVILPLGWTFSVSANTFTISVTNPNDVATTVQPLLLNVTGVDDPIANVYIVGANTLGVNTGDISFTASTITVSSNLLSVLDGGGTLSTTFAVVPEASTFIMMSLVASGLAGGYMVRRRKVQG